MAQGEIRYPDYLKFKQQRQDMNTAMMALLAGSQLAANTLNLTAGSDQTLREIFPRVSHIERFNLRSDVAQRNLQEAEAHLARIGIPYVLALQEAYMKSALDLLRQDGIAIRGSDGELNPPITMANMHEVFAASCGTGALTGPSGMLELFHALRLIRNGVIHRNGEYSPSLLNRLQSLPADAESYWEKVAGHSPNNVLTSDGGLRLNSGELVLSFGVNKSLAISVNAALGSAVSAEKWAEIAVEHFASGTNAPKNSSSWARSLKGFVRHNYAPVQITPAQLQTAAVAGGYWTIPRWI
ncbi:hypothetical protein [Corynebacterium wankanglinii]|uniref:Uncharacterized protein n=1 Tax=Corynebacterium wankanglinii TaxID=2735136 RepID=A0A838CM94_9CORY|nr:hypothetical protein [Corynebacterium wankanglinii]MBA1835620.1 hypothetical protein [Corynebacterium wankanglinii]